MSSHLTKIAIRIPVDQLEWLKAKSAAVGSSYNFYIRMAITEFIRQWEEKAKNDKPV